MGGSAQAAWRPGIQSVVRLWTINPQRGSGGKTLILSRTLPRKQGLPVSCDWTLVCGRPSGLSAADPASSAVVASTAVVADDASSSTVQMRVTPQPEGGSVPPSTPCILGSQRPTSMSMGVSVLRHPGRREGCTQCATRYFLSKNLLETMADSRVRRSP